jgi:peptidoglycan-N-acetylglucosamine deacetylase
LPRLLTAFCALALLCAVDLAPKPGVGAGPLPEGTGCVALTFDDGPDATLTPMLLTILEQEKVHATFFVVGQHVAANPKIVEREHADADEIGNHTWDHRLLAGLPERDVVGEIARTDKVVVDATGARPDVIRPPYGIISASIEAELREHGLMRRVALWDTDTFDWLHENAAWTVVRASAVADGSVVLLHDIHPSTVAAVPSIIRNLRARGLRLTTFSGLASCLGAASTPPAGEPRIAAHILGDAEPSVPDTTDPLSAGRLLGSLLTWGHLMSRIGHRLVGSSERLLRLRSSG